MKNLLYAFAALLIVIWGILYWGLHASGPLHLLPEVAGVLVLIRNIFDEQLTSKKIKFRKRMSV